MNTERCTVKSLTLDPNNARTHDERNVASIIASLERFGQQKPIVVDVNGRAVAGNGTLLAAREMGGSTSTWSAPG